MSDNFIECTLNELKQITGGVVACSCISCYGIGLFFDSLENAACHIEAMCLNYCCIEYHCAEYTWSSSDGVTKSHQYCPARSMRFSTIQHEQCSVS